MAIFSYRASDKNGRSKRGLLRAGNEKQALELLRAEGLSRPAVKPYREIPDPMALLVFAVFFVFIALSIAALLLNRNISRRPIQAIITPLAILLLLLVALILIFRLYLRQTLPQRTLAHLDTGAEDEAFLIKEHVRGEFIPEAEPKPVLVREGGVEKEKLLIGRIERLGLPNHLHLLICLAGYYLPAVLAWVTLPAAARSIQGRALPAWGLALGLSLLVIPTLLITLALKLRRRTVITAAAAALALHLLWLRQAWLQNPESNPVYKILSGHPARALLAWVIPVGMMLFLEGNKKIKDLIRLELPIYEDPE